MRAIPRKIYSTADNSRTLEELLMKPKAKLVQRKTGTRKLETEVHSTDQHAPKTPKPADKSKAQATATAKTDKKEGKSKVKEGKRKLKTEKPSPKQNQGRPTPSHEPMKGKGKREGKGKGKGTGKGKEKGKEKKTSDDVSSESPQGSEHEESAPSDEEAVTACVCSSSLYGSLFVCVGDQRSTHACLFCR